MATVQISNEVDNVPPGSYQAVVSVLMPDGTMISSSKSDFTVPVSNPVTETPPVVTVS